MSETVFSPVRLARLTLKLFRHVSRRRRVQFLSLLLLTTASSIAEVVSLGAVVPFIGILTQPEKVYRSHLAAGIVRALGIPSPHDLILPLALAFGVAAMIAGALRLALLWVSIKLANSTGADIGLDVYRRTLFQPYRVHVARSSSEIISSITQKADAATAVLIALVSVATSLALFIAILATLFAIDPMVATVSLVGFGVSYGIIALLTRHRLVRNSRYIAREQTTVVRALQEGLGAIREILLDGTQDVYCAGYRKAIDRLQKSWRENAYISQAPRFAMEPLGMVIIAGLAYWLSLKPGGVGAALPVLGALALGAQRLLPLLQQLYGNWSTVAGSEAALVDVLALLEQPLPDEAHQPPPPAMALRRAIQFDNVSFQYRPDGPWVLDRVSLTIPRGACVGFVGRTGSGKSTALDLLMLLLEPTCGSILVDDQPIGLEQQRAWRRTIAHVPQNIFLGDTTIAANIAFGIPHEQIDIERVRQAARQAQIAEFIDDSPAGYDTLVGERGVRLSGGQRQRIGIARALYKRAAVLIFDEATSALDTMTENAVMTAIESLNRDLTIFVVAHRLTTLQDCDTIVELDHGRLVGKGSYEEFVASERHARELAPAELP